jgi:hypothetical protein
MNDIPFVHVRLKLPLFLKDPHTKRKKGIMAMINRLHLFVALAFFIGLLSGAKAQTVYYVSSEGGPSAWMNWDIYSYDIGDSIETRLSFDPAIDNHPSISHADTNMLVFSSTRNGGEFNIFVTDVRNFETQIVQLTFNDDYPDRHPHWHPGGNLIIFTSKNRPVTITDTLASECSQPIITFETRYYEGMNLVDLNFPGTIIPLTIADAWDMTANPGIWMPDDSAIYVGHPSFNNAGNEIVFTAAIDGEGKNWEVYRVGFNTATKSLMPNSLTRVTHGPNIGANPIKLSGGAVFSHDGMGIIFNSTRTTGGNSQIFSIPSDAENLMLTDTFRRTFHHGNDYVPEPLDNGQVVITSDLGEATLCKCDTFPGATDDLDVVLLEITDKSQWKGRRILGSDSLNQTLLLADEVSWFCGHKPNLTNCTFQTRIMSLEALWLEWLEWDDPTSGIIPTNLLAGYGSDYAHNAKELYKTGWENLDAYLWDVSPNLWFTIIEDILILGPSDNFPGFVDPIVFQQWSDSTAIIRRKKYVVPSVMYGIGLGDSCYFESDTTASAGIGNAMAERTFHLAQNIPNPFTQTTTISYEIRKPGDVEIRVYDILGKVIAEWASPKQAAGSYSVTFNGAYLPAGLYFCSMRVNGLRQTMRMVLLR